MGKQTRDEETWQLAATRAAHRVMDDEHLTLSGVLHVAWQRSRSYRRRVRGVTPAEAVRRSIDYCYWFLDLALETLYWRAYGAEDEGTAHADYEALQDMRKAEGDGDMSGFVLRYLA